MIISKSNLTQDDMKGEVAIVTGAGRGIGYETARALVWLGAYVVIAEIDEKNGKASEENINHEFGPGKAFFVKTDIGSEKDIDKLAEVTLKKYGKVDIVLNNATVFPMGAVIDTPLESWDFSYRVNLRGPVSLVRKFLPAMIERKHGTFVCVSSSSSIQVLREARVPMTDQEETRKEEQKTIGQQEPQVAKFSENKSTPELYQEVLKTYLEQSEGWKKRNLFERQWINRDFKKTTGMSIDEMQTTLKTLGNNLKADASTHEFIEPLSQLAGYYMHQQEQLRGFEKNPQKLEENLKIIEGWVKDTKALMATLKS